LAQKYDAPTTVVSEVAKLNELFLLGNGKSSIPAGTWNSSSSGITYTYSNGLDLYSQVQAFLLPYQIVASDWNGLETTVAEGVATAINTVNDLADVISLGGLI